MRSVQSPNWNGAIINNGMITVHSQGIAALVAPGVANFGVIQANLGTVILAGSNEFILDFYGDHLIQFGVNSAVSGPATDPEGKVLKEVVSNSGKIIANGGVVLLTAKTASSVIDRVINLDGTALAITKAKPDVRVACLAKQDNFEKNPLHGNKNSELIFCGNDSLMDRAVDVFSNKNFRVSAISLQNKEHDQAQKILDQYAPAIINLGLWAKILRGDRLCYFSWLDAHGLGAALEFQFVISYFFTRTI